MPKDNPDDSEPLDLGLFEVMMGMTPEKWLSMRPLVEVGDDPLPPLHDQ